jgi:hypothetical protein
MLNVFPAFDEVICLGDFNVDFSKSPNLLERLFGGYNFLQLINEPTRITENSQILIDLIMVSNINFVTSTKIIHTVTLLFSPNYSTNKRKLKSPNFTGGNLNNDF